MKLLIIGGTRFIGHHLVTAALTRNHEVTLLNRGQHPSARCFTIDLNLEEHLVKLRGHFFLSFLSLFFLSPSVVKAQLGIVDKDAKINPTLVALGTYHMATTTTNVVNNQVADITSPERQKQVVELVEKLKKFKPTKIAL